MPINLLGSSHLHHKYLKGVYCIYVKLEYKPNKFRYFYKIGCSYSDSFYGRLNSFHNCFPFGFDILYLYFMKNTKENIIKAEKFIHSQVNKYRVNTTTRMRKPDKSTSEWFDMGKDWRKIGEAFIEAQNKFTGWILLKPVSAGRDKNDLDSYVPTENELEKIQKMKLQQLNEEYDHKFDRPTKILRSRKIY